MRIQVPAAPWAAGAALGLVAVVALLALAVLGRLGAPAQPTAVPTIGTVRLVVYQGGDLLGGERVDLASVVGQGQPVVLNFFAGLCPPCRVEMPAIERVWQRHRTEALFLGADIGPFLNLGTHEDARRLLAELGITYPAAYVEDNPVAQFRIVRMPTTLFFDSQGRLIEHHSGFLTEEQLEEAVASLVLSGGTNAPVSGAP